VEGTVTLRFAVLPAGTIGAIQVVKSSGNTLLDKAAQKAVRQWRPLPHKGLGRDNTWVHVPFTFALTAQSGSNGHNASGGPSGRVAVNCDAGAKR
jgi:TonB family protein